jgi:hypothetical protein
MIQYDKSIRFFQLAKPKRYPRPRRSMHILGTIEILFLLGGTNQLGRSGAGGDLDNSFPATFDGSSRYVAGCRPGNVQFARLKHQMLKAFVDLHLHARYIFPIWCSGRRCKSVATA